MSAITDDIRIRAIRHISRQRTDTLDFIAPVIVAAKDARIAELEMLLDAARDALAEGIGRTLNASISLATGVTKMRCAYQIDACTARMRAALAQLETRHD